MEMESDVKKSGLRKNKFLRIAGFCALVGIHTAVIVFYSNRRLSRLYDEAMQTWQAGDYVQAEKQFQALGNYADAPEKVRQAQQLIEEDKKKEKRYREARKLQKEGKYEWALEIYLENPDYLDSADMIRQCRQGMFAGYVEDQDYDFALQLIEEFPEAASEDQLNQMRMKWAECVLRRRADTGAFASGHSAAATDSTLISHFPFNHNDIVFRHSLEQ